jgi:hypothetical protein
MSTRVFLLGSVTILLAFPLIALGDPYIEVVPLDHDFGDVQVGSSSTTIVTISNINGHDLEIYEVSLSGSADFAISMEPDPVVSSGMSTGVEVSFTPSATGYVTAILDIESNDMGSPIVTVSLAGMGVAEEPPPLAVEDILAFFDASLADGTLYGSGPGTSADGRRRALRNKIKAAGDLFEGGDLDGACNQLLSAYRRCDGLARPPEFVAGPAAPTLAQMLLDLITVVGCSPPAV